MRNVGCFLNSYLLKGHLLYSVAAMAMVTGCDMTIRGVATKQGGNTSASLSMSSPTNGSTSTLTFATITGKGLPANTMVNIYLNDSTCASTSLVGTATTSATGAMSVTTSSLIASGNGLKTLYYTAAATACSKSGLSYTYQAGAPIIPVVSFLNGGTTITESGVQIGTPLSIQRDQCGTTTTVTIATSDVSAFSGTNYTSGTQTITFNPTDCNPKTVSAASFNIVDDGVMTGDLFFKATITSVTGGVAASSNQIAQVNILDNAYTGDYSFNQPLYTVNSGSTSATLTIQRSTAGVATVDVAFVDGSATNNIDYISTTQTVHFGASDSEITINVPVTVNSYNSSFIAKLQNPSTGTTVRNLSAAKVRIMGNPNVAYCDPTAAPFGGGLGTVPSPYLICSVTQLQQVGSHTSNTFQMMADVTSTSASWSLGTLTGSFDGNEYAIYNISNNSGYSGMGFFDGVSSTSYIKGVNLMYLSITNTSTNTGGLIGALTSAGATTISNSLVSGYVTAAGSAAGMLIGNANTHGASILNCLTYGKLKNTGGGASGMVGQYTENTSYTLTNLINTTSLVSTSASGNEGGVFDQFTANYMGAHGAMNSLENRGFVTRTTGGNVGGIIGKFTDSPTYSMTNLTNYGTILATGLSSVGGIIGYYDNPYFMSSTGTLSGLANYGSVSAATSVGGLIGVMSSTNRGPTITLDSSSNSGAILASTQAAGGIMGATSFSPNFNGSLAISNTTSTGNVTAGASGLAGGLIGDYSQTAGSVPMIPLTLTNVTVGGGTITASGHYAGGLIGRLQAFGYGAITYNITNGITSSTVSGTGATGIVGGLIGDLDQSSGNNTINIVNSGSTGAISAQNYVGGLVGIYYNDGGTIGSSLISHCYATGAVTATTTYAGGLFGLFDISDTGLDNNLIQTSYASGPVTATTAAGGLIGWIRNQGSGYITINDSMSSGAVSTTSNVGSIAGQVDVYWGTLSLTANRFYSTSIMSGGTNGLIGAVTTGALTPSYTSVYWLKDGSNNAGFISDGHDQTAAALQTQATYVGWTFNTATGPWLNFVPGSYPVLK